MDHVKCFAGTQELCKLHHGPNGPMAGVILGRHFFETPPPPPQIQIHDSRLFLPTILIPPFFSSISPAFKSPLSLPYFFCFSIPIFTFQQNDYFQGMLSHLRHPCWLCLELRTEPRTCRTSSLETRSSRTRTTSRRSAASSMRPIAL